MECCVGVSTETVLQIDTFYTVVRRIFKLTFRTVVLRRSERFGIHSDEGQLSETSVRKFISLRPVATMMKDETELLRLDFDRFFKKTFSRRNWIG